MRTAQIGPDLRLGGLRESNGQKFLASAEKYRYFSRLKLSVWHSLHGTPKRGGRGEKYTKEGGGPFYSHQS